MRDPTSLLTVIPARGGSKSIPKKNIAPLGGKPLLTYTIAVAKKANLKGPIVVSTDDEEIAEVAAQERVSVIMRPKEISLDTSPTEAALLHALESFAKKGQHFEMVLTLQPTSPFRKPETLAAFVSHFCELPPPYDAMLSLHEDRTDFWIAEANLEFSRLFPNAPRRRQSRNPLYAENSAYYITDAEALKKTNSILGTHPTGFQISLDEALDINEPADLKYAEFLLNQHSYA